MSTIWSQHPQVHHHIVGFQIAIAAYVEISNAGLDMSFAKSAGWSFVVGCWLQRISNLVKTHSISLTLCPYLNMCIYTMYIYICFPLRFSSNKRESQVTRSSSKIWCLQQRDWFQYMFARGWHGSWQIRRITEHNRNMKLDSLWRHRIAPVQLLPKLCFQPFVLVIFACTLSHANLQGAVLKYMNSFFALYYVAFFKESQA